MTTITQTLTTPTTAPSRGQTPTVFNVNADARLAWQATNTTELGTWAGQANTVAGEVNTDAATAATQAGNASTSATNALASEDAAAASSTATIWVSGTTYAVGDVRFSASDFLSYRRKTIGAGTTDPSADATNWAFLPGAGLASNIFTGLQTLSTGADIASATAVDLTAATGNTVVITGTTPSTSLTMTSGQVMTLLPSGAWPLTYHATTMNINGGASYTAAAGDRITAVKDLAGVIRVSVVKQDGTAVVAAAGGTNGWHLLSTVTASSSATVDVETTFDGTYDEYMIVMTGMTPQTDSSQLGIRFKQSGTYTSANYRYHATSLNHSSALYFAIFSASASYIALSSAEMSNNSGAPKANITIHISNPSSTSTRKSVYWSGTYNRASVTGPQAISGAGGQDAISAITGIRFLMNSGNITSGKFRLYGLSNS